MSRNKSVPRIPDLGKAIRWRRNNEGLTVNVAAEKANISFDYWKKIEASKRYPSPATFDRICVALGTSGDELREEATSFGNFILSTVGKRRITFVIEKGSVREPWEVSLFELEKLPSEEDLTIKRRYMIDEGWIDGDETISVRPSNHDENEAWLHYVIGAIDRGRLNTSGEGLLEILDTSVWVSQRYHKIEKAKEDLLG